MYNQKEKEEPMVHVILTVFIEYLIIYITSTLPEVLMEIKEIRRKAGLTQESFAEHYRIPLQTLKQWESSPESKSYRKPPEYVTHMLERLARHDFNAGTCPLTRAENLVVAAKLSRDSLRQWLRYLNKEFQDHQLRLTKADIASVLSSGEISMIQKIVFKRAILEGTATNDYVVSLSEKAKTPMVDALVRRTKNEYR